jgi:hypothetical protein
MTQTAYQKLIEFAAKDPDVLRREIIESMREDKPDITQEEIDWGIGLIEATIGF